MAIAATRQAEVPTDFWEQARKELDQAKPDIIMLAEAQKPDLLRSAFDIDYAWPMLHTVDDIEMNGEPATKVRDTIEQQDALFPRGALHMRMSDDHDELAGDDALWFSRGNCRVGADVHAQRHSPDL